MKPDIRLFAFALLGAASIAMAQLSVPNPQSPGMSMESAVRLVIHSEVMLDRSINRWLRQHYPGWTKEPHEIRELGFDRFAIVRISSPNFPDRKVYFRLATTDSDDKDGFPTLP